MASAKKAQVSGEFFVILTGVGVLLLVFTLIYSGQIVNLFQARDVLTAKTTAYQLASAIDNVYLGGNGASYNLSIAYGNGNITISGNNVIVEKNRIKTSASILTNNTNTTNTTVIEPGTRIIKNNNGLIEIG